MIDRYVKYASIDIINYFWYETKTNYGLMNFLFDCYVFPIRMLGKLSLNMKLYCLIVFSYVILTSGSLICFSYTQIYEKTQLPIALFLIFYVAVIITSISSKPMNQIDNYMKSVYSITDRDTIKDNRRYYNRLKSVEPTEPSDLDNLEDLVCAICLSVFKDPRTAPCGHSYCSKCLDLLIQSTTKPSCPICREKFDRIHCDPYPYPLNSSIIKKLQRHNKNKTIDLSFDDYTFQIVSGRKKVPQSEYDYPMGEYDD